MNIIQTLILSLQSIKGNRLRTMLTVLGVVVGIFSIIVIMTIITMLQDSIQNGVSQLNKNTFQIQKFPAMMGGGPGMHDRFRNRKDITLDDYERLKALLTTAKYIGAEQWTFGKVVKFGSKETNPNIQVAGVVLDAIKPITGILITAGICANLMFSIQPMFASSVLKLLLNVSRILIRLDKL